MNEQQLKSEELTWRVGITEMIRNIDEKAQKSNDHLLELFKAQYDLLNKTVSSLKEMVELRANLNELAIKKAEDATMMHFANVDEFRKMMTAQASFFVSRTTLDALISQINVQVDNNEKQFKLLLDQLTENCSLLSSQLASLSSKVYLGGSALAVIMLVVQLFLNIIHSSPTLH